MYIIIFDLSLKIFKSFKFYNSILNKFIFEIRFLPILSQLNLFHILFLMWFLCYVNCKLLRGYYVFSSWFNGTKWLFQMNYYVVTIFIIEISFFFFIQKGVCIIPVDCGVRILDLNPNEKNLEIMSI